MSLAAENSEAAPMFRPLIDWQGKHGVNDSELGRRVGVSHSTIRRAKRGQILLSAAIKIAIKRETGIALEAWAPFEENVVAVDRRHA
jgi:hypothetical protein